MDNDNQITRVPITSIDGIMPDSPAYESLLSEAKRIEPLAPLFLRGLFMQMKIASHNANQEQLVDTEEMAKYLHLQPKTVRKMAKDRQIPFIKIPPKSPRGKMLFKIKEVEQALTNNVVNRGRPRRNLYDEN